MFLLHWTCLRYYGVVTRIMRHMLRPDAATSFVFATSMFRLFFYVVGDNYKITHNLHIRKAVKGSDAQIVDVSVVSDVNSP